MNSDRPHPSGRAFTLIELLLVIGIIGILAALLLPALSRGKLQAKRAACGNNLQEIGLGFHSFAHEHESKFPMRVLLEDGGTLQPDASAAGALELFAPAYGHLRALSNELVTPKILVCPMDLRIAADQFSSLNNDRVSYFVAVNAEYGRPTMVLAGDRNLASAGTNAAGNPALRWTEELHRHKGNVLFADGHVERLNNPAFEVAAIGGTPQNVVLPEPGSSGPTAGLFPQEKPQPPPPTPEPSPTRPVARNQAGSIQNPASLTPSPTALLNLPLARFPIPPGVISVLAAQPKATVMHTNQTATVPEAASSGEAEALGTFDQAAVRYLQRLVKGGFGLLLLLLLLLLAYAVWREWRKGQKRRARQQVTPEGL